MRWVAQTISVIYILAFKAQAVIGLGRTHRPSSCSHIPWRLAPFQALSLLEAVAIALHLTQCLNYLDLEHGSFGHRSVPDSAGTRKARVNQVVAA